MPYVQWAKGSQFNWVHDNQGGAALMELVAGNWSGANLSTAVAADGKVYIQTPLPGGGQVAYLRGVWLYTTVFPWNGFWAEPESGDLTNYYTGGSFANSGARTTVTLGTPLAPGTVVQLYYLYYTGVQGSKYQALNNYPCVRPAWRDRADYTYDFAVDRVLDLMAALHFAGRERGRDYAALVSFLWDRFYPYEASRTSPLVMDDFERSQWNAGSFLLYRDSTLGAAGFEKFAIELYPGDDDQGEITMQAAAQGPRALRVLLKDYSTTGFTAWWGYGMNWSLAQSPLADMSQVRLKLRGPGAANQVHNICKISSGGSATMVLKGIYSGSNRIRYVVWAETTGEIGTATFKWSDDGGITWHTTGCKTSGREQPTSLGNDLEVYWEAGSGNDFVAGDYWTFMAGDPEVHPRRLLVTLNDSAPGDADEWGAAHTYVHGLPDRYTDLTQFEIDFSQFKRIDNIVDDRDRRRGGWWAWYSTSGPEADLIFTDREVEETVEGDTYYTQLRVETQTPAGVTAWGVWTGINTAEVNSTGKTNVNYLIYPILNGVSTITIRTKVKDANGSYFYKDTVVNVQQWNRVTVNFADMLLESGSFPITHPLQVVDIGVGSSPPADATFHITDVKFNDPVRFTGAARLRLLEFKYPEINQDLEQPPAWWLDDVGLDLTAGDAYPYAPRQAISLEPYGQNSWRGPTLVHYAHPLAPYLMNRLDLAANYLYLHRDAQDGFNSRYGGIKGPILPVHTRNDIEAIPLCGEEDFTRFSWWLKYRNYGLRSVRYLFNDSLIDSSGNGYTLTGTPTYVTGICQPGNTAVRLNNTYSLTRASNANLVPGSNPFTLILICKGAVQTADYVQLMNKMGANGWAIQTKTAGVQDLQLKITTSAGDFYSDITGVLDGSWHMIAWIIDPANSLIHRIKDGTYQGNNAFTIGTGITNTTQLTIGPGGSVNFDLDYFCYERRILPGAEYENAWDIVQGNVNGSSYPEAGHGLGQYWAFYRLAEYFFSSNDAAAWDLLENWLTWIDAYGAVDGSGWKFPVWFSDYGFVYGYYDPGVGASLALGCLYIYLRNGNATAQTWARRILDDLRLNRQSGEFGGYLYKSDYHYAWMNALVGRAFGLAVAGRSGQVWVFPATAEDAAHFDAMLAQFFALAGDGKPNMLNADYIPFSYVEDADIWEYVPNYLMLRQMGSLEGLVLMLSCALDYAKRSGSWAWFDKLLAFVLLENLAILQASAIRSLSVSYELRDLKNLVRVTYGDYDRDNSKYAEEKNQALIDELGELPADIDLRYGSPVITEDPQLAALLAARLLFRLSAAQENVELETWLEGVRLELGDDVAISSDFHGFDQTEFRCFGKQVSLDRRRVALRLMRQVAYPVAWTVDGAGTDYDCYAIDQAGPGDPNWSYRAYVY